VVRREFLIRCASIVLLRFFASAFDLHTLRVLCCNKICTLCRDDLENDESLETGSNATIKFHHRIDTIRFLIFSTKFRFLTESHTKRRF